MFNKLKQIKVNLNNQYDQGYVEPVSKKAAGVAATIAASPIADAALKPSIISESAVFDGNLTFNGVLHLDGKYTGNIKADKITIGKSGSFNGKFEADTVIVFGEIKGEVVCRDLTLNAGSNISGNISYFSIKVQPGSTVSGELICTQNPNKNADD